MTNDHASSQARPGPRHPSVETDDRTQQVSKHRVKKFIRTLLKGWRALAFLLIVLIVGYFAFHYKGLSDPGSESKQLANHAPLEIDFLVSNPNTSIDVLVGVSQPDGGLTTDEVSITIYPPPNVRDVTFLMLAKTSLPDLVYGDREGFNRLESLPTSWSVPAPADGSLVMTGSIKVRTSKPEELLGEAYLDTTNDIEQTNAYLYGHLPAIGTIDQSLANTSPAPAALAESYKNTPYRIRDMYFRPGDPDLPPDLNPKHYGTPYGGPAELFWTPAKLSIRETQSGLAPAIENQQVTHITPGGQPNGPDYTWQGSGYLEPTFQTTDSDALQSESDQAFLSGVLFGVAGAAAIAFVQEIPETFSQPVWWSRRKRKRKSSAQNAADTGIAKEAMNRAGLGWPQ